MLAQERSEAINLSQVVNPQNDNSRITTYKDEQQQPLVETVLEDKLLEPPEDRRNSRSERRTSQRLKDNCSKKTKDCMQS